MDQTFNYVLYTREDLYTIFQSELVNTFRICSCSESKDGPDSQQQLLYNSHPYASLCMSAQAHSHDSSSSSRPNHALRHLTASPRTLLRASSSEANSC